MMRGLNMRVCVEMVMIRPWVREEKVNREY